MSVKRNRSFQSSSSPNVNTIDEVIEIPELGEENLGDGDENDEIMEVEKSGKRKATDPSQEDTQAVKKKEREKTSDAWKYFDPCSDDPKTGNKRAVCKLFKQEISRGTSSSTSAMNRHLKSCLKKNGKHMQTELAFMSTLGNSGNEGQEVSEQLTTFKYDHAKMREKVAHYIMINELPFIHVESYMFNEVMRTATPFWKKLNRKMVKSDCRRCYDLEKNKLKEVLKGVGKVNITTDMWTSSNQKLGYMVVTGQWIDSNWKLNMRVLNFFNVPPPHSGVVIADALSTSFADWGIEKKLGTITVDNAKANDVALRNLKQNYMAIREHLPLDGKLFHVRCCAHILNLLVQDGLRPIESIIDKIRDGVKYVAGSEGRRNQFGVFASQLKVPLRKLVLDVPTRWNSTYNMLKVACKFKLVFRRFGDWDKGFEYVPNVEDWERVSNVCDFIEVFNDVTHVVSGSQYPTANLFLSEVYRAKEVLDKKCVDEKLYVQEMAIPMKEKFDKYWSECNLVMSIGSVLDPRFKLHLLKFCFPIIYGTDWGENFDIVKDALSALFQEYVYEKASGERGNKGKGSSNMESSSSNSGSHMNTGAMGKSALGGISKYGQFLSQSVTSFEPVKTELETYLEEQIYLVEGHFDALNWWKANQGKYPVLSRIAADVLAIPITTVASESTFSAGGRVIEPHRACLKPETVEMLLCGADWAREIYGLKKTSQKEKHTLKEVEIELNIPSNEASGSNHD